MKKKIDNYGTSGKAVNGIKFWARLNSTQEPELKHNCEVCTLLQQNNVLFIISIISFGKEK